MTRYVFRVDDICPQQNYEQLDKLFNIFKKYRINPIIGVIPNNQDENFDCKDKLGFWKEIKEYQNIGWTIALHGYRHVFHTNNSGVLGVNNYSEFSGRPFLDQLDDLNKGKAILNGRGIKIDTFMAPAHSFDKNTIKALKAINIDSLTDGFGLFPYFEMDFLFIPQLFAKQRKMPFGIYTNCIHAHELNDLYIEEIENFIINNKENIITFSEARNYVKTNFLFKIMNLFIRISITAIRKIK